MIYADQRWIGDHGIGRFARHVLADIDYRPVALAGHRAAPPDAWRLSGGARFVFTIHDLSHIYCPEHSIHSSGCTTQR
jgi:hypothetical protein